MGAPERAPPRLLLELSPHNVCIGFLLAIYIREYEASSLDLHDGIHPHHELAVFLMEVTATATSSPMPFPTFCSTLDAIHPSWSMEFQVAMRRLSNRSVHDVSECLEMLCLPRNDEVFVASSPFGRFSRMLALAIRSAFFDGLCSFRDAMQAFVTPFTPSTTALRPSTASVLDAIDNGLPVDDILLHQALQANPSSTRLLFARYVNFQRQREFLGAMEALHKYHNTAIHVAMDIPDMKRFGPHYASLNLAIFYWTFRHPAKAIAALHETIRVAQSARDKVCVAYALSYLLQWDAPFDPQRALTTIEMADAAALPHVSLLAQLSAIQHGSPLPVPSPATVISLQTWLALQAAGSAATNSMCPPMPTPPDGLSMSQWLMEPKHARLNEWVHTQVVIHLTQAQTWRQLGFRTMQRQALAKAAALASHRSACSSSDVALLLSHQAQIDIETQPISPRSGSPWGASTAYAPALGKLAQSALDMDNAIAKSSDAIWSDSILQQSLLNMLVAWAVARMELRRAESLVGVWASLVQGQRTGKPCDTIDFTMAKARLLRRQGRQEDASTLLDSIPKHTLPPFARANVLLQQSHMALHPDVPFNALPALMECLATCEEVGSQTLVAQAKVLLARLYVAMERTQDAIALLEDASPYVRPCDSSSPNIRSSRMCCR
ncbi:hypothetical protein, variant 1 [Aphanomyces invadans]|uniref:Anaphase-promoting complex subunit 5 n=1 Tax=Aphanomyces invadans TaxID=157072 RepID=A0A024TKP5_9STRA|nr:hypothetical protein, variant 1 [Aphanomyces invadans]ETV94574.1 hypothetical protein, variant 1 [Aphanomyces invadans]|eukprot:XP_008876895.1 hypothetical protein, variant 1 [Aphanomyces invadans]